MCSRYYVEMSPELRPFVEAARRGSLSDRMVHILGRPKPKEGEVRPSDIAAVIASDAKGQRSVFPMVWGFFLSDIENTRRSSPLINARIETAAQKVTWRECYARRRCIIPASCYFEWQRILRPDGKQVPGDKYVIQPSEAEATYMAGLYRIEDGFPHFAILTRAPGEQIRKIHDRMPVILPPSAINAWIDPRATPEEIKKIADSAITAVIAEKAG